MPFLWVGGGIGGRWLYGALFDAPAADAATLVTTGVLIGAGCYVLAVILPVVLGTLRGK